jgi:hypothetical protein
MKLTKLILEIQNRIKLPAEFNTVRGDILLLYQEKK